jgi:hypothetical protein
MSVFLQDAYGGQMKKVMVKNGNFVAARSNYLRSAWQ